MITLLIIYVCYSFIVEKFPTFETLLGGEVVNMEWGAETPFRRTAGGLNMIGVIWLKRKS